jgi:hypothetical protein
LRKCVCASKSLVEVQPAVIDVVITQFCVAYIERRVRFPSCCDYVLTVSSEIMQFLVTIATKYKGLVNMNYVIGREWAVRLLLLMTNVFLWHQPVTNWVHVLIFSVCHGFIGSCLSKLCLICLLMF